MISKKCLYDIEVYNTTPREKQIKVETKSKKFFEYCFDAILCL